MGLLTNGITNLLMKTVFKGTAKRIDGLIDPKGRADVINASNDFKKSVVELRQDLSKPSIRKTLKEAGVNPDDLDWKDVDTTLYNEDGTPK